MADIFTEMVQKLAEAEVSTPRLEARLLLAAAADVAPSEVFSAMQLNTEQITKARELLKQRLAHKPLDKILGHRAFYKSDFLVDENVLSPRPDTEILVEKALQYMPENASDILDLGTGSGCIIASILLEKPQLRGTAVDISASALNIARQNAKNLDLLSRLKFMQADWFVADFIANLGQKFDIIVSNPPYIPSAEIETLAPEVKNYDPLQALDGGVEGFDSYKRIAELAPKLLKNGGYILLESGYGQAQQIADIFASHGLVHIETVADLNNIPRCVILQKAVAKCKKS